MVKSVLRARAALRVAIALAACAVPLAPAPAADPRDDLLPYRADQETRGNQRVYCIAQAVTGAKRAVRTCRTRAQWIRRGAQVRHLELEASCPPMANQAGLP